MLSFLDCYAGYH
jgi:ribonuclease HI